jgi:hypothetical protein
MSLPKSAHPGEGRDPDGMTPMSARRALQNSDPCQSLAIWIPAFAGMSGELS